MTYFGSYLAFFGENSSFFTKRSYDTEKFLALLHSKGNDEINGKFHFYVKGKNWGNVGFQNRGKLTST